MSDEQPYDDRDTPTIKSDEPFAGRWSDLVDPNDVGQALDYLINRLPSGKTPKLMSHRCLATVLNELVRLRIDATEDVTQAVPNELLRPTPGLVYADPQARFECKPAEAAWREAAINAPEMFNLLELRVMSAHVATAFDNITRVLGKKAEEAYR